MRLAARRAAILPSQGSECDFRKWTKTVRIPVISSRKVSSSMVMIVSRIVVVPVLCSEDGLQENGKRLRQHLTALVMSSIIFFGVFRRFSKNGVSCQQGCFPSQSGLWSVTLGIGQRL